jgi:tetratricopeptide (TPR) repeat protein
MDLEDTLKILRVAGGDPYRLVLSNVDLFLSERMESERAILRVALEVASVPHWFDEKILSSLLELPLADDVLTITSQLLRLPVIESFPARGPSAANVRGTSRLILRERMKNEAPDRLSLLSKHAKACFEGAAPHLRIEALYHAFSINAEVAEQEFTALCEEWQSMGRDEELLALGVVLDELLVAGLPAGALRASVLYQLARIRYNYQPLSVTADQTREAVAEAEQSGALWQIANAKDLAGKALNDQGNFTEALSAYRASLSIRHRLVAQDPDNTTRHRELSIAQENVGNLLRDQGDLSGALEAYRASLDTSQALATQNPIDIRQQHRLFVSHERVGDMLRTQEDLGDSLNSYRQSLEIARTWAKQDPADVEWQRALAVVHSKIGDVLQAQGHFAKAQTAFEESSLIIWHLFKQDPRNVRWQQVWEGVHGRVGEILEGWLRSTPIGRHIDGYFTQIETLSSEITPVRYRPSTLDDIGLVASQERAAHYEDDAVPLQTLQQWYLRNRNGFNMLLYNDRNFGHLNLLPFTKEFFAKFLEGKVTEKEATQSDIYPPASQSLIKDIYIESFAILHPSIGLRGQLLIHVLSRFTDIISSLCPPNQIELIYALAATKLGESLLERLNFSQQNTDKVRKDRLKLFVISYSKLSSRLSKYLTTKRE